MANLKVWIIKYVAGNPKIFSKITTDLYGPRTRSNAIKNARRVAGNNWRAWVEHQDDPERRIYESEIEKEHGAKKYERP